MSAALLNTTGKTCHCLNSARGSWCCSKCGKMGCCVNSPREIWVWARGGGKYMYCCVNSWDSLSLLSGSSGIQHHNSNSPSAVQTYWQQGSLTACCLSRSSGSQSSIFPLEQGRKNRVLWNTAGPREPEISIQVLQVVLENSGRVAS